MPDTVLLAYAAWMTTVMPITAHAGANILKACLHGPFVKQV